MIAIHQTCNRPAACLAALVVVLLAGGCTLPTASQKMTKAARPGAALAPADSPNTLPGNIALVYTYRSEINLLGFENTHPADIHRQGKIFKALVADGAIDAEDVYVPQPLLDEELLAVHDRDYLDSLRRSPNVARALEAGAIGIMPDALCQAAVVTPFRYSAAGTVMAAELAIKHGLAINLGGGFHHAFRHAGGGFCLFADVPLAILTLRSAGLAERAMIVDCDIHQGNGNASFFIRDPQVRIFDIYEDDNYPSIKQPETNPHPIPRGISTADYLALLKRELPPAIDAFRPQVIFYLAGNDAFEGDALGHADISADGLVQRDLFVVREARRRNIPTVMVLAGGYSSESWRISYRSIAQILGRPDPARAQTAPPKASAIKSGLKSK